MLDQILKLYVMGTTTRERGLVPHLFGPPGCGKSSMVAEAAELLGVTMHTINVSRISPLELEGVQMPDTDNTKLNMLHSTLWTQLKEGDILLLDEFLRGFPEVYNGLLDILTAREVAGFKLPNVFIIAASNSTVAYDPALEDRLMHLPVPDPRKNHAEVDAIEHRIVNALGLHPDMVNSPQMNTMVTAEILPTYDILDALQAGRRATGSTEGHSIRNIIAQAKLRNIQSRSLQDLLVANNDTACATQMYQYIFLFASNSNGAMGDFEDHMEDVAKQMSELTDIQKENFELNKQLLQLHHSHKPRKERTDTDDVFIDYA